MTDRTHNPWASEGTLEEFGTRAYDELVSLPRLITQHNLAVCEESRLEEAKVEQRQVIG